MYFKNSRVLLQIVLFALLSFYTMACNCNGTTELPQERLSSRLVFKLVNFDFEIAKKQPIIIETNLNCSNGHKELYTRTVRGGYPPAIEMSIPENASCTSTSTARQDNTQVTCTYKSQRQIQVSNGDNKSTQFELQCDATQKRVCRIQSIETISALYSRTCNFLDLNVNFPDYDIENLVIRTKNSSDQNKVRIFNLGRIERKYYVRVVCLENGSGTDGAIDLEFVTKNPYCNNPKPRTLKIFCTGKETKCKSSCQTASRRIQEAQSFWDGQESKPPTKESKPKCSLSGKGMTAEFPDLDLSKSQWSMCFGQLSSSIDLSPIMLSPNAQLTLNICSDQEKTTIGLYLYGSAFPKRLYRRVRLKKGCQDIKIDVKDTNLQNRVNDKNPSQGVKKLSDVTNISAISIAAEGQSGSGKFQKTTVTIKNFGLSCQEERLPSAPKVCKVDAPRFSPVKYTTTCNYIDLDLPVRGANKQNFKIETAAPNDASKVKILNLGLSGDEYRIRVLCLKSGDGRDGKIQLKATITDKECKQGAIRTFDLYCNGPKRSCAKSCKNESRRIKQIEAYWNGQTSKPSDQTSKPTCSAKSNGIKAEFPALHEKKPQWSLCLGSLSQELDISSLFSDPKARLKVKLCSDRDSTAITLYLYGKRSKSAPGLRRMFKRVILSKGCQTLSIAGTDQDLKNRASNQNPVNDASRYILNTTKVASIAIVAENNGQNKYAKATVSIEAFGMTCEQTPLPPAPKICQIGRPRPVTADFSNTCNFIDIDIPTTGDTAKSFNVRTKHAADANKVKIYKLTKSGATNRIRIVCMKLGNGNNGAIKMTASLKDSECKTEPNVEFVIYCAGKARSCQNKCSVTSRRIELVEGYWDGQEKNPVEKKTKPICQIDGQGMLAQFPQIDLKKGEWSMCLGKLSEVVDISSLFLNKSARLQMSLCSDRDGASIGLYLYGLRFPQRLYRRVTLNKGCQTIRISGQDRTLYNRVSPVSPPPKDLDKLMANTTQISSFAIVTENVSNASPNGTFLPTTVKLQNFGMICGQGSLPPAPKVCKMDPPQASPINYSTTCNFMDLTIHSTGGTKGALKLSTVHPSEAKKIQIQYLGRTGTQSTVRITCLGKGAGVNGKIELTATINDPECKQQPQRKFSVFCNGPQRTCAQKCMTTARRIQNVDAWWDGKEKNPQVNTTRPGCTMQGEGFVSKFTDIDYKQGQWALCLGYLSQKIDISSLLLDSSARIRFNLCSDRADTKVSLYLYNGTTPKRIYKRVTLKRGCQNIDISRADIELKNKTQGSSATNVDKKLADLTQITALAIVAEEDGKSTQFSSAVVTLKKFGMICGSSTLPPVAKTCAVQKPTPKTYRYTTTCNFTDFQILTRGDSKTNFSVTALSAQDSSKVRITLLNKVNNVHTVRVVCLERGSGVNGAITLTASLNDPTCKTNPNRNFTIYCNGPKRTCASTCKAYTPKLKSIGSFWDGKNKRPVDNTTRPGCSLKSDSFTARFPAVDGTKGQWSMCMGGFFKKIDMSSLFTTPNARLDFELCSSREDAEINVFIQGGAHPRRIRKRFTLSKGCQKVSIKGSDALLKNNQKVKDFSKIDKEFANTTEIESISLVQENGNSIQQFPRTTVTIKNISLSCAP